MDNRKEKEVVRKEFTPRGLNGGGLPAPSRSNKSNGHSKKQRNVNRYGLIAKGKNHLEAIKQASGSDKFNREMQNVERDAE
jgi:hypothetical protein